MKIFSGQYVLAAFVFAAPCISGNMPSLAAEPPTAESLEKDVSRLEDVWKAGKHCGYFVAACDVATHFRRGGGQQEQAAIAARLLQTLLARELNVAEFAEYVYADNASIGQGSDDIAAMADVALWMDPRGREVSSNREMVPFVPAKDRTRYLLLIADLLGRIRKEIIPNFKPKRAPLDPILRDGGESSPAGAVPGHIADPVARAKCMTAIRDGIVDDRQEILRAVECEVVSRVKGIVYVTLRGRKDRSALFAECVRRARLTDAEQKEMLTAFDVDYLRSPGEPHSTEAKATSVEAAEKELARLEGIWQLGQHCPYFLAAYEFAERFREMGDRKTRARIGAKLLQTMLCRRWQLGETTDFVLYSRGIDDYVARDDERYDLDAMADLASWLGPYCADAEGATVGVDPPSLPAEERLRNLMLIADLAGRVRKEIVPNYKEQPGELELLAHVDGMSSSYCWRDFENCADPVERARYKAAIRQGTASIISYERQQHLKEIDSMVSFGLSEAIFIELRLQKGRSGWLAECAKRARLTDEEQKKILKSVEEAKQETQ